MRERNRISLTLNNSKMLKSKYHPRLDNLTCGNQVLMILMTPSRRPWSRSIRAQLLLHCSRLSGSRALTLNSLRDSSENKRLMKIERESKKIIKLKI